jgi:hypothetical protein
MFVEIYPNNKSICQYSDDCFNSIKNYNSCQLWDEKGNELIVVLDTNTRNHAVYERLGNIYCLEERFDLYSIVDSIDGEFAEHNAAIRNMLVEEALDKGFPLRYTDAVLDWPMRYEKFARLNFNGTAIQTLWGYWGNFDWDEGSTSYMYQELSDAIKAIQRTNPVDVIKDHDRLPDEDERIAIRVFLDYYENGNPSSGPDGYAVWDGNKWDLSDLNVVMRAAACLRK